MLGKRRRFPASEVLPYIIAQVIGAIIGAGVIYLIAIGKADFDLVKSGLAANGFDAHSPGKYTLGAGLVAEIVLTFMFLMIILGATDQRAPQGFAPIAIGLGLTLIHLIGIPVTNVSVNPARSYRSSHFCRWLGPRAALALLGRADYWAIRGWHSVSSTLRWHGGGESPSSCLTGAPWWWSGDEHAPFTCLPAQA